MSTFFQNSRESCSLASEEVRLGLTSSGFSAIQALKRYSDSTLFPQDTAGFQSILRHPLSSSLAIAEEIVFSNSQLLSVFMLFDLSFSCSELTLLLFPVYGQSYAGFKKPRMSPNSLTSSLVKTSSKICKLVNDL